MFLFQLSTPDPESVKNELHLLSITAERRLLMLSTAMFIAMAFGFLGFGLFLIQAKGDVDAEGSVKDYKFKFTNLSPGLFVILCSTVIIIFAATFKIDYGLTRNRTGTPAGNSSMTGKPTDAESPPDASDEELGLGNGTDTIAQKGDTAQYQKRH